MGRKSSAKQSGSARPPATPPQKSRGFVIPAVVALAAVVGVGGYLYSRNSAESAAAAAASESAPLPQELKPHTQATYPALNFPGYPTARPREVVTAAYMFAAEHPEILSYVPCFCGCERMGHRGNEDCFVKARDVNGDVVAWEDHGMECAVCLDVATRAQQMYKAGKPVDEIRAAVDKEWKGRSPMHTSTPAPPQTH